MASNFDWSFLNPFNWIRSSFGKYLGTNLTGAEREANAFIAQQNREAMAFEKRMAQGQMDFQAEQAATQWQRGVADMQAAGLNPALAYGQGGASAMSGSSGAGHAGASVAPGAGSLSDLIQLATLKPLVRKMNAEATSSEIEAENKERKIGAEIDKLVEEANITRFTYQQLYPAQIALAHAQENLAKQNTSNLGVEQEIKRWERDFINRYHVSPQLAGELAKGIAIGGAAFINAITKRIPFLGRKGGGR